MDSNNSLTTINPTILDSSIGDIAIEIAPLNYEASIIDAFSRFMRDENLMLIPVIYDKKVVGQIQRNRFLENVVLGKYGYGIHLNSRKCICDVMEHPNLVLDYGIRLEQASNLVQGRHIKNLYDDIIITVDDKYFGVVPINILLDAITQKSIILAKDANPLTGLPGNWAIQREIEKRIRDNQPFDVSYIDINHFKPYNDHYGFSLGDKVIVTLGRIISENIKDQDNAFAGHIGGDDFIIISNTNKSNMICESILQGFENYLSEFHSEDFIQGFYISKNRKGEQEVFELLSIACAIVSTESYKLSSYAQLASISAEVKAEAKRRAKFHKKSIIFRERRKDLKDP